MRWRPQFQDPYIAPMTTGMFLDLSPPGLEMKDLRSLRVKCLNCDMEAPTIYGHDQLFDGRHPNSITKLVWKT